MQNNFLVDSKLLKFHKGLSMPLLPNFNLSEFHCQCNYILCNYTYIDYRILNALDRLRRVWGLPLVITSAFRCNAHNRDIGSKYATTSKHLKGSAIDLAIPIKDHALFVESCKQFFDVVIYYPDKNFVHCHFN